MPKVEVCFTPEDFHLYKKAQQTVVVIDVLRATSVICTALSNGIEKVITIEHIEDAKKFEGDQYIIAGERNGEKVDGFQLGNSPLAFLDNSYKGKSLILTTTNGTRAVNTAKESSELLIGSLLNAEALCHYLAKTENDVLLLCSGWKGKTNLEDSICAGYIADALKQSEIFISEEDSTIIAETLFVAARNNPMSYIKGSSHRERLLKLGLSDDIKFCLRSNTQKVIPIYTGGEFVKL